MIKDLDHNASLFEKNKDDFQWDKDAHEYFDNSLVVSQAIKKRMQLKDRLAKGKMPVLNAMDLRGFNIQLPAHARKKDFQLIPHFPLIDQVYEEAIGEKQKMAFEPMAIDLSQFSTNEKRRLHDSYLENYLMENIYNPYIQQKSQEYFIKNGIEDITQVSHEDQQQIQSDIEKMVPEKINEYFELKYVGEFSAMAQSLTNIESMEKQLKLLFDERFKDHYKSAAEITYMYESHGFPRLYNCKRVDVAADFPNNEYRFEYAEAIRHETHRSLISLVRLWGDKLSVSDIKKLEKAKDYGRGMNGDYNISGAIKEVEAMKFYGEYGPELFPQGINQRTKDGQEKMLALRAMVGTSGNARLYRDCHTVYTTPIAIKRVMRIVKNRKEYCWRSAEYVMNPDHGDVKVKTLKGLQARGCRGIGIGSDKVYIDCGPLKYAWADYYDPKGIKLPYSGGYTSDKYEEADGAPFDKGINFQVKINVENGRLEEEKGFNLGKIFVLLESAIPDNWTPEMFFDTMKGNRVISLDESKISPAIVGSLMNSGRIFNSVDMSNDAAVKDSVEQMETMYMYMRRAMGVEGRQVSPYSSNENMRQQQDNASTRTFDIYNKHNEFMNNTLNMYIDFCMHVYRRNPKALEWMVDDKNMAILISEEFLINGRAGIYIKNGIEEQVELREFKIETQPFIQTGNFEVIEDFAAMKKSRSWGEYMQAAKRLAVKAAKIQQKNQEAQAQMQAQIDEAANKQIAAKIQHEAEQGDKKNLTNVRLAEIGATQLLQANDVNNDQINDANQREDKRLMAENQNKEKERALTRQTERESNELQLKMSREKNEVDLKKITAALKRRPPNTKK